MNDRHSLTLEGNTLLNSDGIVVATLNPDIGEQAETYGRLFANAGGMADLLEAALIKQVNEFDRELKWVQNSRPASGVSRCGPEYLKLPIWVQTGLALIARIKGSER